MHAIRSDETSHYLVGERGDFVSIPKVRASPCLSAT